MPQRTVVIRSAIGLHARPASLFSRAAAETGVTVLITAESGRTANAASILAVLALGIDHGETVVLESDEPGADAALDTLAELLSSDLDAL
ncbi:HPr family phosphocarrier protein [Marisediminicola sp. LYQ85]|uniref:HPr family phosphocarrier protein n=1 Tax=Marisediminicola sp. LYQ85 TaxID=3391062 RepID=UPI003983678D